MFISGIITLMMIMSLYVGEVELHNYYMFILRWIKQLQIQYYDNDDEINMEQFLTLISTWKWYLSILGDSRFVIY